MGDLSDEELALLSDLGRAAKMLAQQSDRMLFEIRRHRAALAADKERVRQVVITEFRKEWHARGWGMSGSTAGAVVAAAVHVADQLATSQAAAMEQAHARIEGALQNLGAEHQPPEGWQERVLSAVDMRDAFLAGLGIGESGDIANYDSRDAAADAYVIRIRGEKP